MITAMITIFVIGYLLIALEHTLKVNKSTFALVMCDMRDIDVSYCRNDYCGAHRPLWWF